MGATSKLIILFFLANLVSWREIKNIPVYGYLYDVKTSKLIEMDEAIKSGRNLIG